MVGTQLARAVLACAGKNGGTTQAAHLTAPAVVSPRNELPVTLIEPPIEVSGYNATSPVTLELPTSVQELTITCGSI
jgi:hypothetical protein